MYNQLLITAVQPLTLTLRVYLFIKELSKIPYLLALYKLLCVIVSAECIFVTL